jgi:hypothetical protein
VFFSGAAAEVLSEADLELVTWISGIKNTDPRKVAEMLCYVGYIKAVSAAATGARRSNGNSERK